MGVHKIIKSDFVTPSSNYLTILPGNFNFFILEIFEIDFSYIKILFVIFFFLILLNKDEPNKPHPTIKMFFILI